MIQNDILTPMDKTAQFYIPSQQGFPKRIIKKLNPLYEGVVMDIPTFSRNNNNGVKSSSQPNLLNLSRDKNFSFHFDFQQNQISQISIKTRQPLLGIQQRLLFPKISYKKHNSLEIETINNVSSPEKSKKILKALLNPQKKTLNNESQKNTRSTKSQGRSFLQSRPQLNLLNRIFSSKSQHDLL